MSKTKMNITPGNHRPTSLLVVTLVQVAIMLSYPALAQNKHSRPVSIEANVSLEWDQTKGVYIAIGDAVKTTGARIEVGHPAKIHEIRHIDGSWHISHIAHIHPGAHVPRADHPLILEASEISAVVAGLSSV